MNIRAKTNCFLGLCSFCFNKCLAKQAFKNFNMAARVKNCLFSDHSERTLFEIYIDMYAFNFKITELIWSHFAHIFIALYT